MVDDGLKIRWGLAKDDVTPQDIFRLTDTEGLDTYRTREVKKIDFSWIAFFSNRMFVMMGPRYYEEAYESYVFQFRIGYMFGDPK